MQNDNRKTTLDIVTLPDPILRQKAAPVTRFDDELQELIDSMIDTMRAANGVGLAGPQVGELLRLTVIEPPPREDEEEGEIENSRELFVVINPKIIWRSPKMVDGIEGCLSIPGYLGEVNRHESIRVEAQDRHGKRMRIRLKDWTARIFQHEIDHLDGILYIDKLTEPENLWTEEEFHNQFTDDEPEEM